MSFLKELFRWVIATMLFGMSMWLFLWLSEWFFRSDRGVVFPNILLDEWISTVDGNLWLALIVSIVFFVAWNILFSGFWLGNQLNADSLVKIWFWIAIFLHLATMAGLVVRFFLGHSILDLPSITFSGYWLYLLPLGLAIPFTACLLLCSPSCDRVKYPFAWVRRIRMW